MAKYMLIMRGTDESMAKMMETPLRGDARDRGPVQRGADPGRRAGRRRGAGRPGPGRGGRLQRRDPGGHRRPVRRDEGAVRRLLPARRGVEGGGRRVGPAGCRRRRARSARSAGCRASTSSRRTTSGSSRSGRGASGPASSDARTADGPPSAESARRAVEAVWRIESARIVGALARYTGDFALAEDVAQEAVAEALVTWSRDGAPANPVGWLLATARRRAIDSFRRRSALDERYAAARRPARRGRGELGRATPQDGRTTCRGTPTGSTTTSSR